MHPSYLFFGLFSQQKRSCAGPSALGYATSGIWRLRRTAVDLGAEHEPCDAGDGWGSIVVRLHRLLVLRQLAATQSDRAVEARSLRSAAHRRTSIDAITPRRSSTSTSMRHPDQKWLFGPRPELHPRSNQPHANHRGTQRPRFYH